MTPEAARMLLHAHIDGELDAASTIELESQIQASPELGRELERLSALRDAVQNHATRFDAPSRLSRSLFSALPAARAESVTWGAGGWRAIAVGTSAFSVALLVWALSSGFPARETRAFFIDEVVSAHVRSLMVDHLTDLASAERHSIKPWLSNRLDFAPPVHDFTADGFVLTGARLDYIRGQPAAAIVYRHRQHIINVFVQPSLVGAESSIELRSERGYNSASFESAGMSYWAISDVNQNDLGKLAKLLQRHAAIS
jgi:anti-sigma factor RsiW